MKTIVVSGAHSKVGKTHLARAICGLLPGAVRIKIGHGKVKPGGDGFFYPLGTPFAGIAAGHATARYLVIESNSILRELTPDCAIYLAADNPKPSAALAEERADIVRGKPVDRMTLSRLAGRLACSEETVRQIAEMAGGSIHEREQE
jgi:hypothetical protein